MISQRLPGVANDVVAQLNEEPEGCLVELQGAAIHLDRCGFIGRPSWEELQAGARPPVVDSAEPGDWLHGWQHHASSSSEYHHRETWCCPNRRMLIRPISSPIQAQGRVPCSTDPPLRWSTQCNPCCSALFFSRERGFQSRSRNLVVSAGPRWTSSVGTEERARGPEGSSQGVQVFRCSGV